MEILDGIFKVLDDCRFRSESFSYNHDSVSLLLGLIELDDLFNLEWNPDEVVLLQEVA